MGSDADDRHTGATGEHLGVLLGLLAAGTEDAGAKEEQGDTRLGRTLVGLADPAPTARRMDDVPPWVVEIGKALFPLYSFPLHPLESDLAALMSDDAALTAGVRGRIGRRSAAPRPHRWPDDPRRGHRWPGHRAGGSAVTR